MSTPWITGGTPQKDSGSPEVTDLYKSPNVFINNVPVVLYAAPDSGAGVASSAFDGDVDFPPVPVDPNAVTQFSDRQGRGLQTPGSEVALGAPGETASPDGAVSNIPGQVNIAPTGGALIPWLEARVREANNGSWLRVNPPHGAVVANPGNPNIAGIWRSLGLSGNAFFQTDQPAWCMGFVNFALKSCGYVWCPEASAAAIAANPGRWKATQVPINQAAPGDIVLWSWNPGAHHVNFVYTANGSGPTSFIGGNQSSKTVTNNNNPSGSTVSVAHPSLKFIVGIYRPHKG